MTSVHDQNQIRGLVDLNFIHIKMNNSFFVGSFNSAFCCSDETLGLFFSIVFESPDKNYFICKLNFKKHSYEALSIKEINLLNSYILSQENRIQGIPSALSKIQVIIEDIKNTLTSALILEFQNIKVFATNIQTHNHFETGHLKFNNDEIMLKDFCTIQTKSGCSAILRFPTGLINKSSLLNFCLYRDLSFSWTFDNKEFTEYGIIVNCQKSRYFHQIIIQSYSVEMLQSIQSEYLSISDMKSPFAALNFLVMKNDVGVNGVNVSGYESVEHIYLIATAINNFLLGSIEPFSIGSVRIGEEIELSQDFRKVLQEKCSDKYTLIWTYQQANNHLSAYNLALEKISNAFNTICFIMKNSTLSSSQHSNNIVDTWDIKNHLPQPKISDIYYIEDCAWRENITFIKNNSYSPNFLIINKDQVNELISEEIEKLFDKLDTKNKSYTRIMYAISWLNSCWILPKTSDKIISIIMAIEFLLSGEKGNSILEDYLDNHKMQTKNETSLTSCEILNSVIAATKSISFNLEVKEEQDLSKQIVDEIKKTLTQSSFNSKLEQLIARLNIPLNKDDLELIRKARKIRNHMIHGREIETMPILEIKILCNAVSQIIKYKLAELNSLQGDK